MNDYEIGKDIERLDTELKKTTELLLEVANTLNFNITNKRLALPTTEKKQ